ncbi:MAG: hypothetical protein KAR19_17320 [Bacteroidales bacterium]|nr:hypothetical protein [Bacteroidales bacterium]
MINHIRFIWQLLVLTSVLLILGILVVPTSGIELSLHDYIVTLLSVTGINLVAYLVMTRGFLKSSREEGVFLLAGIGVKFMLYLLYILVYWGVTKNLTKPFIITFFALYLVFTFLLARHLFKLLENK